MLNSLAEVSEAARIMLLSINYGLFDSVLNTVQDKDEQKLISYMKDSYAWQGIFSDHIDFLKNEDNVIGFYSRKLEHVISVLETFVERIEEDISIFLFSLFFIPIVLTQLLMITGLYYILVGMPLIQTLMSVVLRYRLLGFEREILSRY